MQRHANGRMLFKESGKWQISLLVAAFHDIGKIAAGLVGVNDERKVESWGHGDASGLRLYDTARARLAKETNSCWPRVGNTSGV